VCELYTLYYIHLHELYYKIQQVYKTLFSMMPHPILSQGIDDRHYGGYVEEPPKQRKWMTNPSTKRSCENV